MTPSPPARSCNPYGWTMLFINNSLSDPFGPNRPTCRVPDNLSATAHVADPARAFRAGLALFIVPCAKMIIPKCIWKLFRATDSALSKNISHLVIRLFVVLLSVSFSLTVSLHLVVSLCLSHPSCLVSRSSSCLLFLISVPCALCGVELDAPRTLCLLPPRRTSTSLFLTWATFPHTHAHAHTHTKVSVKWNCVWIAKLGPTRMRWRVCVNCRRQVCAVRRRSAYAD